MMRIFKCGILTCSLLLLASFYWSAPTLAAMPDFTALEPDIPIFREKEETEPLHQEKIFTFEVSRDRITEKLTESVKASLAAANENPDLFHADVVTINSVNWFLVDQDMNKIDLTDKFPTLITEKTDTSGMLSSQLKWPFLTPTDPMNGYILVVAVKFRWNLLRNNTAVFPAPLTVVSLGKKHLQILDLLPPTTFHIAPEQLHGFCGEKLSDFNTLASDLGVNSLYSANPQQIVITFYDDNPNGFSDTAGILHHPKKVNAFFFIEGFQSNYQKPVGESADNGNLFPVNSLADSMLTGDAKEGILKWSAPIPVAQIPGMNMEVEQFDASAGRKRTGFRITFPLKGLDTWLESNQPNFSTMPIHFATNASMQHNLPELASRLPLHLRYTVALSDSSGNLILPSNNIITDETSRNSMLNLQAGINANRNEPSILEHEYFGRIIVLDHIAPNLGLIVTNNRTHQTGIFTVANSSLAQKPWKNQEPEWSFSADGSGSGMADLTDNEQKKLKNILNVAENDRLLFQVVAWDNISRNHKSADNRNHGISTPLVGDPATPSLLRYQTFKILDKGAISEEQTMEETPTGQKISCYPDYIFRRASTEEQSVFFYVHDFSTFRDPTLNNHSTTSSDFFAKTNRRGLKLIFKVHSSTTVTEKLSGSDTHAVDK